jgi:hypothetical protein
VPPTTASCPRCGTAAAAEAARCGECGFVFFERPARRSLPRRLARQLDAGPAASVRCTGPIRSSRSTRCQFLYPDGDTQLMLVTLSRRGELDIDVPYPAQRRPGR